MPTDTLNACIPPFLRSRVADSSARYSRFTAWAMNLLQLNDVNNGRGAENVPGLARYTESVRRWAQERQRRLRRADDTARMLSNLSKKELELLAEAVYEEQLEEDSAFTGYTEAELRQRGFTDELIQVKARLQADFEAILDGMQEVAELDARRRFRGFGLEGQRQAELQKIRAEFAKLRRRPYFPLMRFGKHVLQVIDLTTGRTVEYQLHDTELARDAAARKFRGLQNTRIVRDILPDQKFVFQGLPPAFAEGLMNSLELSADQRREFRNILNKLAPEQSFRKRLLKRKGTRGFSRDLKRTYANYMSHGANHIARLRYGRELLDHVAAVRGQAKETPGLDVNVAALTGISNYMERHRDYIMNPRNELAFLRGWGFLWYLGFMPKSAFVNLTQVPLVTLPYLSQRYGNGRAVTVLSAAMRDVWRQVRTDKLPADEVEMFNELTDMGLIDQSFATELAAVSEGRFLQGAIADSALGTGARSILGHGALLFSLAEKVNRRVTAAAAFRLHKAQLLAGRAESAVPEAELRRIRSEATVAAREAIERTQFEYSAWNRPPFMQGKQSVIFLFFNYVQNMLFFVKNDPGRWRYLFVVTALAGLQGIPFAEDLFDLLDAAFSKALGHKVQVRKELREFFDALGADPDLMMLGLSSDSFGLAYIGQQVGIPIPSVDVQGSLSFGRPLRFTEPFLEAGPDADRNVAAAVEAAGGPALAIPLNIYRAIASNSPNMVKRVELASPSAVRSLIRAARYAGALEGGPIPALRAEGGVETTLRGTPLADLDTVPGGRFGAALMQGLGFTPTPVNKQRRAIAAAKEVELYYATRKTILLSNLNWAHAKGDRDLIRAALKDINEYNGDVPYPELRITNQTRSQSRKAFQRRRRAEELGVNPTTTFRRVTDETRKAYER